MNMQAMQQIPPTHMKVPVHVFGAMMNLLYTLPYMQVAELIGQLGQSEPVFPTPPLDPQPGVRVESKSPSAAQPQQTENGSNEDRQRTEP